MTGLEKIERYLLQFTVFLIPANFAYHFYSAAAYVNGHLVDYFLPKLYLSDILILGVISLYVFNKRNVFDIRYFFSYIIRAPFTYFVLYLLWRAGVSPRPLAGIWFVSKIIEFTFFSWYLQRRYTKAQFLTLIRLPLQASILIQIATALYQFINQKSLFGYIFMGEPFLESVSVVKNNYFGLLEVSPYGTTPHPNVLAGFLCIGFLLTLLRTHSSPISKYKKAEIAVLIGLIFVIFYLTQSLGACLGFLAGLSVILLNKLIGTSRHRLLVLACCFSSLIMSPIILSLARQLPKVSDNPSITTRYELNQLAFTQLASSPLFGSGPNQFIQYLPQTTLAGQKTLFLQPVHNLFLLVLAETGSIGCLLLFISLIHSVKNLNSGHLNASYLAPLVGILLIGSLDHYPLTLQTGQLLLAISLTLPLLKQAS